MERRERLCLEFADKAIKHSKFRTSLSKSRGNPSEKAKFADTIARPSRLNRSPTPYFTRLLNKRIGY